MGTADRIMYSGWLPCLIITTEPHELEMFYRIVPVKRTYVRFLVYLDDYWSSYYPTAIFPSSESFFDVSNTSPFGKKAQERLAAAVKRRYINSTASFAASDSCN